MKTVRLNTDTSFLKLIAILTMLVDHLGAVFFPQQEWMRIVGRLAFPIFAYCIAAGAAFTHSMPKYLGRMLIMAVIAQPIYVLAMGHAQLIPAAAFSANPVGACLSWYLDSLHTSNILFELSLGLALIWSLQSRTFVVTAALTCAAWYLSPFLRTSYGWQGIVMMVIFYALIDQPLSSFVWQAGFMAWWGFYSSAPAFSLTRPNMITQAWALLALPLIYIPMNTGIKLPKWVFYLFYPAHLAVIYALKLWLK